MTKWTLKQNCVCLGPQLLMKVLCYRWPTVAHFKLVWSVPTFGLEIQKNTQDSENKYSRRFENILVTTEKRFSPNFGLKKFSSLNFRNSEKCFGRFGNIVTGEASHAITPFQFFDYFNFYQPITLTYIICLINNIYWILVVVYCVN